MKLLLKFDSKTLKFFYEFIADIYKCKPPRANSILLNFTINNIFVMYSTLEEAEEKKIEYNYIENQGRLETLFLFEYMILLEEYENCNSLTEYTVSVPGVDLNIEGNSLNTIKISMKQFASMKEFISNIERTCQSLEIKVKGEKQQDNTNKNFLHFEAGLNSSTKHTASFEVRVRKIIYKMNYINLTSEKRIATAELNNLKVFTNVADKFKAKCTLNKVDIKTVNIIFQAKLCFTKCKF